MDTKPENYARNVIAIVAPIDSPKKGNPSDDFKRIFIGLDLDDILNYLIEKTCEALEQVDVTRCSAERVLEDLNMKCQKLKESLITSTTLQSEDATFKQKNLYCMALSMVLQKYAGILTINLGGANTAINAVDIDAAADVFCDKKNPIRSLSLLFHAYESGLLSDVDLKQFLASQLSDVISAGKNLMESLVKVGAEVISGPKQPTLGDIGINASGLIEIGHLIIDHPLKKDELNLSSSLASMGKAVNCVANSAELGEFSIGAYSIPCRFWVSLKETVFLLLRGIIRRYENSSEIVSRLYYLKSHLAIHFDKNEYEVVAALMLAVNEFIALCERDTFGVVNDATLVEIKALLQNRFARINTGSEVYIGREFPEKIYKDFLYSLWNNHNATSNYGIGTITDVVVRLCDEDANPLMQHVPWVRGIRQLLDWISHGMPEDRVPH